MLSTVEMCAVQYFFICLCVLVAYVQCHQEIVLQLCFSSEDLDAQPLRFAEDKLVCTCSWCCWQIFGSHGSAEAHAVPQNSSSKIGLIRSLLAFSGHSVTMIMTVHLQNGQNSLTNYRLGALCNRMQSIWEKIERQTISGTCKLLLLRISALEVIY